MSTQDSLRSQIYYRPGFGGFFSGTFLMNRTEYLFSFKQGYEQRGCVKNFALSVKGNLLEEACAYGAVV